MSTILFSNIFNIHQDEKNNKFIFKLGSIDEKKYIHPTKTLIDLPNSHNIPTLLSIFNDNCDPNTNGEKYFFNSIKDKIEVIFDVGSRDDSDYLLYDKEVHYFEPNPKFYQEIKNKPTKNKLSHFNNFGLSNKTGYSWYYPKYQSFYNRILSCKKNDEGNKIKLSLKTASEYIKTNNITHIDFLKIDTEGSEFNVLKGFEDLLSIVDVVQLEYGGTFIDNNTSLYEVLNYLYHYGFSKFYYISPDGLILITNYQDHYKYCNIACFKTLDI